MWQTTTKIMCGEILNSIFETNTFREKPQVKFLIASTIEEAKEVLEDEQIHLLFLDKDLGTDPSSTKKINGVDHIQEFKSLQPFCQILMLTADISVTDIARAMKNGASDYLFKSNDEIHKEHRIQVIRKSIEYYFDQLLKTKKLASTKHGLYSNYVFRSLAMQRLDNKLLACSESSRPILLLGATGLGKGAVSRRINELTKKLS